MGKVEVRIVDEETLAVRGPTANERLVLDANFLQDPKRLPWQGSIGHIGAAEVCGMRGVVLRYVVVADDSGISPFPMLRPDSALTLTEDETNAPG